ncbi:MAG: formyltransferase family protein [Gemmatimonadales bacterium]|nr:formyltransferase family protein [Gemmatimonadales bacterium]
MRADPSPDTATAPSSPSGGTGRDGRLRVLLITEDDPLYVIRFFDVFLDEYPKERIEIVGITVDAAFHESKVKTAQRMWRFFGPVDFVRTLVRWAGTKLSGRSIASLAASRGVPVLPTSSVNSPDYVARVRALAPDVIVSVAAPEVFRRDLLGSARLGCINIHSGRLPVYRGMMPNFWQLLHGEPHATLTVHEMAEKLDAGDVIATHAFPLAERDSLHRVMAGAKEEGARLMIRVLDQLREGSATRTPLDFSTAKYFGFPKPDDVRRFRARGHRMI